MKINVKRTINSPKNEIWPYVADFRNIYRFHPLLKGSHALDDNPVACEIGSTRQCDMIDGNHIKERVIDFKEGSHYTVEIFETSMPVTNATATVGLREISESQTEAYMDMEMESKYAVLAPMMKLVFQHFAAPSILRGLEKLHKKERVLQAA